MTMQLDDIRAFSADQDRGQWFDLVDPVKGKPTGIRVKLAGPDSEVQNRARLRLADDLSEVADAEGRVSAEARERARIDSLARCVLDWEISEDGEPVPFTHANVVRFLRAGAWVQAQVDGFASDRAAFQGGE
ncbi:hypothetical protein SAMN05444398_103284 [Roseovarius pacificus]|uniref:Uncharacterized protein n=1 Tax=Roseovarius pacificus TaxID=337701 RepID=A0A1M7BLN7_9RHOB|nr:hypothetical protein [Roseovarius pacificus]GGO55245.1 hypothetical protein GCM10011315_17300 [Roseovarius pacificus]SHL55479.1 hypothetical protein SAMN05444398_103284 [Roseovarius pacificus]